MLLDIGATPLECTLVSRTFQRYPLTDPHLFQKIDEALRNNDLERAATIAEAALADGMRDPMLLNLAAWRREEAGDFAGAHALLDEAICASPADPVLRVSRGAVMRKQGRLYEALEAFSSVVAVSGDNPAFWLERGYLHDAMGLFDLAIADFEMSATIDPHSAAPIAGIATVAVRLRDFSLAEKAAGLALQKDVNNVAAQIAMARCEMSIDVYSAAGDRLRTLLQRERLSSPDRVIALGLLGDVFDRLNDTEAAFAAYHEAKASFASQHAHAIEQRGAGRGHTAFIASLQTALRKTAFPDHEALEGRNERTHCFLLGYPRSGNTLIENVLASSPDVDAIEERPTLRQADLEFLADERGLGRLARQHGDDLEVYRAAYWKSAEQFGADLSRKVFVDMDPLKGLKLPVIARLFPHARILVMRRDPRDVVWSCFHTNFALSAAALEFTSLVGTARHYAALMQYMEMCFDRLPLAAHEVRYEELVKDFDATTHGICAFLGLDWTEDMRRFDETARRRGVATASAGQVSLALYDGRNQWRRYEAQLCSILPILQPWIDKFGYAD
jgi:tetratricopeptide (TPR) repeat protein